MVRWHDAGNHVAALDSLRRTEPATHTPTIVRRLLDRSAYLDHHDAYLDTLRRHAARPERSSG